MQTTSWLVCAAVLAIRGVSAAAAPDAATPSTVIAGTARAGTLGIRQVAAAHNLGAGTLTFVLEGGYGAASSFLLPKDRTQLQAQAVRVGYALSDNWDLVLGENTRGASDSAYYKDAATTWTQFQLQGAYHAPLNAQWALGGAVLLNMPAQLAGLGFAPAGMGGEAQVRTSWSVHPQVQLSLNLGYLLDRSEHVLSTPASQMQRLALGSAQSSRASWGIGANGWLHTTWPVAVGGLLELCGQWAPGGGSHDAPMALAIGARLVPLAFAWSEFSIGADVRFLGAPSSQSYYAGVLPWYVFAQVAVHVAPFFVRDTPSAQSSAPMPQPSPRALDAKLSVSSEDGSREQMPSPEQAPSAAPPLRMVISGSVLNVRGKPVANAQVMVAGHTDVRFGTDSQTGRFRTLPVACDTQAIQITALTPKGAQATASVACNEAYPPDVALVPRPTPPPPGTVVIIVTSPRFRAPRTGLLSCDGLDASPFVVRPGEPLRIETSPRLLHCTVSAPHSVPQRRTFQVQSKQTTVFNIDLPPRAPGRLHPR